MEQQPSDQLSIKVNSKFINYITPSMIACVVFLAILVVLLHETITTSFVTNVPLNAAIWSVVIFAIVKAFHNNIKLRRTARFLQRIEAIEDQGGASREEIQVVAGKLETEGAHINMQNMYTALENLAVYGHLNFSDNDARLIKSKFGGRTRSERGVVNYFAGILVMMGLIGTFWGLLLTIESVGEAMGSVSESFSVQTSGGGGADIGEFIGAIAAPLQGMGVAFSSSLFGLSGSLFLGLLSFFAQRAQNSTIEMVSRWIDHRIPKLNPALADKAGKQKLPKEDDLKAWLATFVYMSNKTHQRMGQMVLSLSKSNQVMLKSIYHSQNLYESQKEVFRSLENMNIRMNAMDDSVKNISGSMSPMIDHHSNIKSSLLQIRDLMTKQTDAKDGMVSSQVEQLSTLSSQLREMNTSFALMGNAHSTLVKEIDDIKVNAEPEYESSISEINSLIGELSDDMQEIDQKNIENYINRFAPDEPEETDQSTTSTSEAGQEDVDKTSSENKDNK